LRTARLIGAHTVPRGPGGIVDGLLHLGRGLDWLWTFVGRAGIGDYERVDDEFDVRPNRSLDHLHA